jgi:predicted alpha/beta hydrolase family esterase
MPLLIVPGIHNSGPAHWQTLWEQVPERGCRRFEPSSFDQPDAWNWVAAIERAVAELGPDTTVLAHSLGCLAAAHVAATSAGIRGIVLVSPPDVDGRNFPRAARRFRELEPAPLRVPALVLASSDDPYASPIASSRLAEVWGAPRIDMGALGHINEASGLGSWDGGWHMVQAFVAGTSR